MSDQDFTSTVGISDDLAQHSLEVAAAVSFQNKCSAGALSLTQSSQTIFEL